MPKLSALTLDQYRPQEVRREIRDTLAANLYLVIQPKPSGTMSWALRFRRPDGTPAKLTLGRVDLTDHEPDDEPKIGDVLTLHSARRLAAKIAQDRNRGLDVIEERKAKRSREQATAAAQIENSFGKLLPEFFKDHKTKKWQTRPRHWRAKSRGLVVGGKDSGGTASFTYPKSN